MGEALPLLLCFPFFFFFKLINFFFVPLLFNNALFLQGFRSFKKNFFFNVYLILKETVRQHEREKSRERRRHRI